MVRPARGEGRGGVVKEVRGGVSCVGGEESGKSLLL